MDFIVDSSVVAKWVLNEPGGEKARELGLAVCPCRTRMICPLVSEMR